MMEKSSIYKWSVGSLSFPYCQRGNRRNILGNVEEIPKGFVPLYRERYFYFIYNLKL